MQIMPVKDQKPPSDEGSKTGEVPRDVGLRMAYRSNDSRTEAIRDLHVGVDRKPPGAVVDTSETAGAEDKIVFLDEEEAEGAGGIELGSGRVQPAVTAKNASKPIALEPTMMMMMDAPRVPLLLLLLLPEPPASAAPMLL